MLTSRHRSRVFRKAGRGLTLAALGALVLVTASCTTPEVILSGDRINVLPEIVVDCLA